MVLVNHDTTDGSDYRGIPTKFVPPHFCPPSLADGGLIWKSTGEPTSLVPFAVLCRASLSVQSCQAICRAQGIRVVRIGKSLTKYDYANAIVQLFFKDESWETREAILHEWLASGGSPNKLDAGLNDMAVSLLDEDNQLEFTSGSGHGDEEPVAASATNEVQVAEDEVAEKIKRSKKGVKDKDKAHRRPQQNYTL